MLHNYRPLQEAIKRLVGIVTPSRGARRPGEQRLSNSTDRRVWLGGAWLLAVLVLWAVMAGLSARAGASAPRSHAAQATAAPSETAAPEPILNPFPPTEAMTKTVEQVLEDYNRARRSIDATDPIDVASYINWLYLPVVSRAQVSTVTPTPTRTPIPAPRADIAVTLWPSPSIHVARGGNVDYEIRLKNYGAGGASSTRVTLPFNNQQLAVVGSRFASASDWVSEVTSDRVVVTFGPAAPGEYRAATITFRANATLADNTLLNMRASYEWTDAGGSRQWRSNWTPLLARAANASAAWVWLSVDPVAGFPGTRHRFFTDRFIPGEGIRTWLNTPTGVRPLTLQAVADMDGRVTLDFTSTGLPRGAYSMVLYGARSNLTAVASFTVY